MYNYWVQGAWEQGYVYTCSGMNYFVEVDFNLQVNVSIQCRRMKYNVVSLSCVNLGQARDTCRS